MVDVSLYVHVPFCTRKCDYCHFFVLPHSEQLINDYMAALTSEWNLVKERLENHSLVSIYFGGGTPSLLGPARIEQLLELFLAVHTIESLEITLEVNPEQATKALMQRFLEAGVNRISLGVQSFDDRLLKTLSRRHDADTARAAVEATATVGLGNISIDLMYELPGQTLEQWRASVHEACRLPIVHLSLYNLTFEEGTPFFRRRHQLQTTLPSEAAAKAMLDHAAQTFSAQGLERYEISAFARKEHHSRHNCGYWQGRPFLGLGPSAFSYWEGSRYRNVAHLKRYASCLAEGRSPVDFSETLTGERRMREQLAIGLRLLKGFDLSALGSVPEELQEDIRQICSAGLASLQGSTLVLSSRGFDLYDSVAAKLV